MNGPIFSPGRVASLACLLEVSAPKPGNVHRGADFEDLTFEDFAVSAVVLGQAIDAADQKRAGQIVLDAVTKTIDTVGTNTNLGICLAIIPLAKMVIDHPASVLDQNNVARFLETLDGEDGANIFQAIRLASPGGLGESDYLDVRTTSSQDVDLLGAMQSAATRDGIAKLYTDGFGDVMDFGVPTLNRGRDIFGNLKQAIVFAHVMWMAYSPDSLIARKCGIEIARQSQFLATQTVQCLSDEVISGKQPIGSDEQESYWKSIGELDFWLRSDGHRRNPGTTADLIAASLFVAIQNKSIQPPFR